MLGIHVKVEGSPLLSFQLQKDDPPAGMSLHSFSSIERRDAGASAILEFILEGVGAVGASVAAAWLYQRLRSGGATRLEIDRRQIDLDEEGQILRILEEHIRKDG